MATLELCRFTLQTTHPLAWNCALPTGDRDPTELLYPLRERPQEAPGQGGSQRHEGGLPQLSEGEGKGPAFPVHRHTYVRCQVP